MKALMIHRSLNLGLLSLALLMANGVTAQKNDKNVSSKISYQVDFGPVYPIEGESYRIVGKVALDEGSKEPETIGFEVPLISFIGQHANYLEWVGNSWDNPDLSFSSTEIKKIDDSHYRVKGRLEFRRRTGTTEIDFTRRDSDNEIIMEGGFDLNTSDYFIISPPVRQVPNRIPFKLTLVFDKPMRQNDKLVSFH